MRESSSTQVNKGNIHFENNACYGERERERERERVRERVRERERETTDIIIIS